MHSQDETISERVLDNGEGLIVQFPVTEAPDIRVGAQSIPSVRAYFFKVAKSIDFTWSYTQLGSFNANGSQDYDYLGDTGIGSGDDVLRLENDDFKVYHVGFGLNSPSLRVYQTLDPSNPMRAVDHSNQNEPDPTAGDNFGFYDGKMQDNKFDPPAHTERVAIRNNSSGKLLKFGFHAENAVADGNSDIEIMGKTYELRPVTDPDEQEFMLQQNNLRRAGVTPQLKVVSTQVGGIFPWTLGESLPNGWNDLEDYIARDLTYGGQPANASGVDPAGAQRGRRTPPNQR
jgi:hypothetical protein